MKGLQHKDPGALTEWVLRRERGVYDIQSGLGGREEIKHIDSLWIFMALREISVPNATVYTQGKCSINIFWLLDKSREKVTVL